MKLLFSNEWLKRKIATDPDADPEAGVALVAEQKTSEGPEGTKSGTAATVGEQKIVQLRVALGVLVRQLRLRDGLLVADLAKRADVSEDELRRVEHDPHYTARPRLIFQLSTYFNVPLANLAQMAGATHDVDRKLYNAAVKYAAKSDDVSVLTKEEREALDAFVAMLNDRAKA